MHPYWPFHKSVAMTNPISTLSGNGSEGASSSRWAQVTLALATLLSSLGASSPNVALPTFAAAFNASFGQVQWVLLAYLLAITTVVVGAGRLGDIAGRRRVLLAGIGLFTFASMLCALAPTLPLLIAARVVQGLGAAAMTALTMACVGNAVPVAARSRALGLLVTMSAIGTAAGPWLGGGLLAWLGWSAIFGMNVPLGIAVYWLARRCLPPDRISAAACTQGRFDHAGTVVLALALAAYALSMTSGRGGFGAGNLALLVLAAAGLVLFVRIEQRASAPLVQLALFRDRIVGAGLEINAMVSTVMMTTLVVGPFYLAHGLGLGVASVGLVLAVGPVMAALGGVPAGYLGGRFGARTLTAVGLLMLASGALALSLMPLKAGLPGYLAALAALTIGYALFQASNNAAVMAQAPAGQGGVVSSLLSLSRNLGLVTGASVMGSVFAQGAGVWHSGAVHPEAMAAGMRLAFGAAAMIVIAALGITWLAKGRDR